MKEATDIWLKYTTSIYINNTSRLLLAWKEYALLITRQTLEKTTHIRNSKIEATVILTADYLICSQFVLN